MRSIKLPQALYGLWWTVSRSNKYSKRIKLFRKSTYEQFPQRPDARSSIVPRTRREFSRAKLTRSGIVFKISIRSVAVPIERQSRPVYFSRRTFPRRGSFRGGTYGRSRIRENDTVTPTDGRETYEIDRSCRSDRTSPCFRAKSKETPGSDGSSSGNRSQLTGVCVSGPALFRVPKVVWSRLRGDPAFLRFRFVCASSETRLASDSPRETQRIGARERADRVQVGQEDVAPGLGVVPR